MSSKMATTHVLYLLEVSLPPSSQTVDTAGTSEQEGGATESRHDLPKSPPPSCSNRFRKPWKQYLQCILPHAERGVRSFMLTALAEGRVADDDDEKDIGKGPAIVCNLSLAQVHTAMSLSDKRLDMNKESHMSKLVMETARRAVELTKLNMEVTTEAQDRCNLKRDTI